MDVARIYEGSPLAFVILAKVDSRVQCVGKAIGEHPGQAPVRQQMLHLDDLRLDSAARKSPVGGRWTLRFKRLGVPVDGQQKKCRKEQYSFHTDEDKAKCSTNLVNSADNDKKYDARTKSSFFLLF